MAIPVTTVGQAALPLATNLLELLMLIGGGAVLTILLYGMFHRKETGLYTGMPAVVAVLLLIAFAGFGQTWSLASMPRAVAFVMMLIIEAVTSLALWPFTITALIAWVLKVQRAVVVALKND